MLFTILKSSKNINSIDEAVSFLKIKGESFDELYPLLGDPIQEKENNLKIMQESCIA